MFEHLSLKIDRMLIFLSFIFFITSLLDGDIDVHTLGGQKHTYEGIWHGIPSRECAYHAAVLRVHLQPMSLNNSFAIITKRDYKIGNVYAVGLVALNLESRSVHVNIYQIKKWYTFDESLKGLNMISVALIKNGYFLLDLDANVSIVYAVLKGDDINSAPTYLTVLP